MVPGQILLVRRPEEFLQADLHEGGLTLGQIIQDSPRRSPGTGITGLGIASRIVGQQSPVRQVLQQKPAVLVPGCGVGLRQAGVGIRFNVRFRARSCPCQNPARVGRSWVVTVAMARAGYASGGRKWQFPSRSK